jgi:transmembrane protein TMEM260 (protein O-mannosyltransferase)
MEKYKKLNNIVGWLAFAIATIVFLFTVEPTASWWDCGEYIATAYKLQVGHPPGAPFFQLLGRIFTLFAFGDVSKVALMINIMSALSSSFTILFLFWTITMLAEKLMDKKSCHDQWKNVCHFRKWFSW